MAGTDTGINMDELKEVTNMAEKTYTLEELTRIADEHHKKLEGLLGVIVRITEALNPDHTETDKQTIQALKELGTSIFPVGGK